MFWRMAGLSTASAVEAILDKDGFTLEELLDEDEIIQECKSLNGRLLNFLRERVQVEQLIRYIIEEPLDDAEKKRTFKFPFQLVDLIGITSIMEVIKRLLGTDEHLYSNYASSMQWVEDTDVLEMIVDKFGSSESPEVHANAAEILCTVARYAPPGLATKLSSPSCTGRLLKHTLEDSRPKSVLVNSLSVCISLLDPKRFTLGTYHIYGRQLTQGSMVTNPETVEGMLGSLGDLLMLLNVSSTEGVLLTTYGKLQPPLGKHRLKIVEFISVLLTVGSEAAEKEIIRLGVVKRVLDLFFEDSDDDDYHDRDYDVAALANNLSQAFRYGVYNNDDMDETQGSMERGDDEDVYFDDESAEVVISSLRLGDDQESSLFTNSNWFAFDDEKVANEQSMASPSPSADEDGDVVIGEADDDFKDSVASSSPDDMETEDSTSKNPSENPSEPEAEKSPAWVEWRETSESTEPSSNTDEASILPNGQVQNEKEDKVDDTNKEGAKDSSPGACGDETIEKLSDAGDVATTESSPDASEAEITEKLKDSSDDASKPGAESDENAQSSEPAISEDSDKRQEADVAAKADDKETEEAVKEPEKVV
ncbi:hypothetical protein BRARA_H01884 [Brassica rapa]|uniref:SIT4 phosphatase-associated family protein n=1 Tax=Brassica campestris TaxID=3711 RepID=A0A397YML2_BRACM|nr:hypothetical protein BRARA_H01884 [Brassica rapa]